MDLFIVTPSKVSLTAFLEEKQSLWCPIVFNYCFLSGPISPFLLLSFFSSTFPSSLFYLHFTPSVIPQNLGFSDHM